MKILTAEQIKLADAFTIREENISSSELMERASLAFTNWFLSHFQPFSVIWIFCGLGNNGGDGLCVGRQLLLKGYDVRFFLAGDAEKGSIDFKVNYNRLQKFGYRNFLSVHDLKPGLIRKNDFIIDALFGIGLNRPPEGTYQIYIDFINACENTILSIDMPSGLLSEKTTSWPCVNANYTISFELPKLSFFYPENEKYLGYWEIKTIGLSKSYIADAESNYFFITGEMINKILHERAKFGHKGNYGHSLIVAGHAGTEGAAELCAYACLTAGSGLVTLSHENSHTEFPELMTIRRELVPEALEKNKFNAMGIGPGLGIHESKLIQLIFKTFNSPVVIDADALNTISQHNELLQLIPANSVLTPHPKEFERLFGVYATEYERLQKQIAISIEHKITIVFKRAYTAVTTPDGNCYFNSTGNAGMATAGSGDVLTGIITALIAQHYSPADAALAGVYLHGLSGDIAMMEMGGQNIVSENLIQFFPSAFKWLKDKSQTELSF